VRTEQVEAALARIQEQLLQDGQREVSTSRLGELVMHELHQLDKVAYVRFASVYRSFKDVDEFRQIIKGI
jgi:transcriptional repressor NrdR